MFPYLPHLLVLGQLTLSARAQQPGTLISPTMPAFPYSLCTSSQCVAQNTSLTLDANFRWAHNTTGYANCHYGYSWDSKLCPDGVTCAKNCALEGIDYKLEAGVTVSKDSLRYIFPSLYYPTQTPFSP